ELDGVDDGAVRHVQARIQRSGGGEIPVLVVAVVLPGRTVVLRLHVPGGDDLARFRRGSPGWGGCGLRESGGRRRGEDDGGEERTKRGAHGASLGWRRRRSGSAHGASLCGRKCRTASSSSRGAKRRGTRSSHRASTRRTAAGGVE